MGLKAALWDTLLEALKRHTSQAGASWSLWGRRVRARGQRTPRGRGREALSLRPGKCQQPEGRKRKDMGRPTRGRRIPRRAVSKSLNKGLKGKPALRSLLITLAGDWSCRTAGPHPLPPPGRGWTPRPPPEPHRLVPVAFVLIYNTLLFFLKGSASWEQFGFYVIFFPK